METMEKKNTVIFQGCLDNVRTMADRSLKVVLRTQELSPDTVGRLYSMQHEHGYVMLSTSPVSTEMVQLVEEAGQEAEFETKTPSQRLRNTLYRVWETERPTEISPSGQPDYVPFDLFYRREMETLISRQKERI